MSLKELKNWIIGILIILILGFLILLLRIFIFDKDVNLRKNQIEELNKYSESSSSKSKSGINKFTNDVKKGFNEGNTGEEYNTSNFDDRLLMYEGEHIGKNAKVMFDILITDADDDFYSKPNVTLENFDSINNATISFTTPDEYKEELEKIRNVIGDEDTYNISFRYGALHAVAKEIIITKK